MDPEQLRIKIDAFLAAYREVGNVTEACRIVGIGRKTPYYWKKSVEGFKEEFTEAKSQARARLEAEARRRAVEGWDEPIFHNGAQVGVKRRYSDTLLIRMLQAHFPKKYGDKVETTVKGSKDDPLVVKEVDDWYGTALGGAAESAAPPEGDSA